MSKTPENVVSDLQGKLSGRIYADVVTRNLYATDASMFRILPTAVVEPASEDDVRAVVVYAKENGIPVTARGAGSGLAGESLTIGIVLDFSVNMNKVLNLDVANEVATIQPGVVQGELNAELKGHGKIYGPDPATSNRCTLGGMIANNATGAHSLRYGMTNRWVKSLKVMLDNGDVAVLRKMELESAEFKALMSGDSREAKLYQELVPLLQEKSALIDETWPDTPRNRHGYLLKHVMTETTVDLAQLFCGSEGTFGIILEAELGFCDLPKSTGLLAIVFDHRLKAAEATPSILSYDPYALEIIDEFCMDMVRTMDVYADLFSPDVKSLLLVEIDGDSPDDVEAKIGKVINEETVKKLSDRVIRCEAGEMQTTVWAMRKHIAGMINRVPGRYQPVPLIEDVCVDADRLAEYLTGVDKILSNRGLQHLCFGHAGHGTVHVRPMLDLKSAETYEWLPDMCKEIYELSMSLEGTISGEHGDGLLRAPFIKMQYGELFDTFLAIKKMFDPDTIFNPGKKVDCKGFETWQKNLRYGGNYQPKKIDTELIWLDNRLQEITEACNGCGACRSRLHDQDMCPMYRAFGTEIATTRAKANLMRSYITGELEGVSTEKLLETANYCINCKMCATNCPGGVKAADLMLELKARCAKELGLPFDVQVLALLEYALEMGSYAPVIQNFLARLPISRKILDLFTGIVHERVPPALSNRAFRRHHRDLNKPPEAYADAPLKVAYFVDTFSDLVTTEVAEAFIAILQHNDIPVVLPPQEGCGILHMNYGNVPKTKKVAKSNVAKLYPYVKAGYTIVATEPTAALMLHEEYEMVDAGEETKAVAAATREAVSFLAELKKAGKLKDDFKATPVSFGYHTPCHLKALGSQHPALDLLDGIPELKVSFIDMGCCGIAGTFGMRRKGYQTSLDIAKDLFAELKKPEYQYGLTECSTCKVQMLHGVPEKDTLHPLVVLAAAYGLAELPDSKK